MLLGDLVQLAKLVREVTDSGAEVKTCAGLYDLYRGLGEVINSSSLAVNHYLGAPQDAPFLVNTQSFNSPEEKWADTTNSDFKVLEKTVKRFVKQLRTLRDVFEIYDSELVDRIEFHFWMKSRWYGEFVRLYQAGHIDLASRRMYTQTLNLAQSSEIPRNFSRLDPASAILEKLESVEEIDVSGAEAVDRLVEAGRDNLERLEAIKIDLGRFIKEHCSIESLIDSVPTRQRS
jgi:hypothetical protein